MRELDLHGHNPESATRRLAQELHACRVRGVPELRVITGRGWGNALQKPILRTAVESWLAREEARALGVRGFRVAAKGGALELELRRDSVQPGSSRT